MTAHAAEFVLSAVALFDAAAQTEIYASNNGSEGRMKATRLCL